MTNDSTAGKVRILEAVTGPLRFFVLVVLVGEALLVLLLANVEGIDRTIAIVGMLVLLLASIAAVYALGRETGVLGGERASKQLPEVLHFDSVVAEMETSIRRLEEDEERLRWVVQLPSDKDRLLDGLYSGVLYASAAVPTGHIDPIFYGNLMEWQESTKSLRVRYFNGPYNEEVITRSFRPKEGVAGAALVSGKIHPKNTMKEEIKEAWEGRLKAMMSVPVPSADGTEPRSGSIVMLNIDSVEENVFPKENSAKWSSMEKRAHEVAALLRRINVLRERINAQVIS